MKTKSQFLREVIKKQDVSNIFILHSLNGDTLKM